MRIVRRIACAGLLAIGGCLDPVAYPCTMPMQCTVDGRDGTCHVSGWCIYPDDGCPSGQRFGPAAGDGLADDCADTMADGTTSGSSCGERGSICPTLRSNPRAKESAGGRQAR